MTSLAHQTLVEHQILEHVKDALRLTLEMKVSSSSLARKLSSVRFMAQSFERHLNRLLILEEDGGYMEMVRERRPQLIDEATRLRHEHGELRELLAGIKQGLDGLADGDEERFHGTCHKLRDLLDRLDEHDAREINLLEQVLIDTAAPAG
ncbi:MAG TPA: hemerythrin domain-containing protein [Pirellulales bacterium]|jgi:hemerythrin-like domain-containing protein|nr:hemerythrin domain-containing protein [Pirellulales bacterium]